MRCSDAHPLQSQQFGIIIIGFDLQTGWFGTKIIIKISAAASEACFADTIR